LKSLSQTVTEFDHENFKIQFPKTWVILPKDKFPLPFVAYRKPDGILDKSQVTINVNIIDDPTSNTDKSYDELLNAIQDAENFKLLESGSAVISGQSHRWLIESHTNFKDRSQQMIDYVFVTHKDGKSYILTMVAFSEVFETYKPIFEKISQSFVLK
jgi:hypothetical protein